MQFVILGYDAKDSEAINRRMAVREDHIKLAKENYEKGNLVAAAALLNEDGQMIGSNLIVDFGARQDLDNYLKVEPYVTGNVWEKIDIFPAKVASFTS